MTRWTISTIAHVAVGLLRIVRRALAVGAPQPNFDWPHFRNTTPVVLALTNMRPRRDLKVVILRRAMVKPHDVILVRSSGLDAELIAQAVRVLQMTRRATGRVPTEDALIAVDLPGASKPPRVDEAERWVASLRSAKPVKLPGVGTVPIIGLHVFDTEIDEQGVVDSH